MVSAINASTTHGLQIISDASNDFEFQRDGVKIAGFTSTGLENSGLENSTITINGTSTALGGTADLEQDCMHLRVTGSPNPVEVANLAVIPFAIHTNVGSMTHSNGTVTIGRDGVYIINASMLHNSGGTGSASGNFRLYKNGSRVVDAYAYAKDYNTWEKATLVSIFSLNANDTLALHSGGTGRYHTGVHSSWTITRIGDG